MILQFVSLLLTVVGLFLSLWIIIPAPTYPLLVLGVGAPEVSPWLILVNAIALLLAVVQFNQSWWQRVYSAKDEKTLKKGYFIAGLLVLPR